MRFLRVEIENFRNIERLLLDLTDDDGGPLPVAVLVGPNGSGKTAVLEAMVRLALPFAWSAGHAGCRPLRNEMRSESTSAILKASFVAADREWRATFGQAPSDAPSGLETLTINGGRLSWVTVPALTQPGDVSPPSVVYMDAARYVPRQPVTAVQPYGEANLAANAAAPSISSMRHQWTKERIVSLKFKQLLDREQGRPESSFDRLWEPVERVFGLRFLAIDHELRIMFNTPAGPVEFDDLSSGERSVILMFAELLLRQVSEATILIDEVELHLHPAWQRNVLDALRHLLPDCQIVVTTQSPIVAASVKHAKHVFVLGDVDAG